MARPITKDVKNQDYKRLNMDIPTKLHNALKAKSGSQGLTVTEVVQSLIEKYVKS